MGSIGSVRNTSSSMLQYAPAYDYTGDEYSDRNDINEDYFNGVQGMEVNTSLNEWVDESINDYTGWERNILQQYVTNSDINSRLRDNPDLVNATTRNLDAVISNHTLSKDTILYSGLSNDSIKNVDLNGLKSGDSFKISSYLSTSPDPVYAAGYALSGSSQPVVLRVDAPAGTHVAKTFYESAYGTEGLIGRNSSFEVVSTSTGKIGDDKVKIIRVKLRR